MEHMRLIEEYLAGPDLLRRAVADMTRQQLQARPIPNKWSTIEVVAHIADFEPIFADRMKRVIAEDRPTLLAADHERFIARLACQERDVEEELAVVEWTRRHMARILRHLTPEDFERVGIHSQTGPKTLRQLLTTITAHIHDHGTHSPPRTVHQR